MPYSLAVSTFDDDPKVRPIPSENYEKVARGDWQPGNRTDRPAAKQAWLFIGRRFVEGIPFTKIQRR